MGKSLNRTLYNFDSSTNKLVLELATSVTASPDGLVHTFKLRQDAFFHNGRKMTADDIIDNDGALAGLAPQIERLHHRYMGLSRGVS